MSNYRVLFRVKQQFTHKRFQNLIIIVMFQNTNYACYNYDIFQFSSYVQILCCWTLSIVLSLSKITVRRSGLALSIASN
jgi:hypothetical protein